MSASDPPDPSRTPRKRTSATSDAERAEQVLIAQGLIERIQRDRVLRKQVEEKGLYLIPPSTEDDKREQKPSNGRLRLDPWVVRINDLRYSTHHLLDLAFNDPNAPAGLYDNAKRSIEDLQATCDLIEGRSRMEDDKGEETP